MWKRIGLAISALTVSAAASAADYKLVVQITVDGFRGDLISRYAKNFGDGGLRRLTDGGVWYTDAHHEHANTETIVGHATLATGAHPSEHGMVGNVWLNRATGQLGYNIEDPYQPILAVPGVGGKGEQFDPAQANAKSSGRSPDNLLSTTFGDELYKSNNGQSKIIGISGKDRSAIAMAGHVGKAFWMSTANGVFETSAYYYDAYPQWVQKWNDQRPADAMIGGEWALSQPLDTYLLAGNDERSYEVDLRGFGRTFPHQYGVPEDGLYYTQVLLTPLGDELTADFAKAAVLAEQLGSDEFPDYLSISFSGVDATNHFFGPSSLEGEEMVRRLDRTLADLLTFLDEEVGAGNVLYVLSGDHGMPEMPEFMQQQGFDAERNFNEDIQAQLNTDIDKDLGVKDAIAFFFRPYIYLNDDAIRLAGVEKRDVERFIVDALSATKGIAFAVPRVPFPEQLGHFLAGPVRRNFHPLRSGDIYVVQSPYSFLFDKGAVAAMHGSPWKYDTHVPIVFMGHTISPARIGRRVSTVDVAVTLSNMFATTVPSGASGLVLDEVVQ
jgi:predicted AlkP superfamily pyrophosphatase or phosphodiesterase